MSKAGKQKYRWYDEDDNDYENNYKKKTEKDRRNEKRIRSAIKGKKFDQLIQDDYE